MWRAVRAPLQQKPYFSAILGDRGSESPQGMQGWLAQASIALAIFSASIRVN